VSWGLLAKTLRIVSTLRYNVRMNEEHAPALRSDLNATETRLTANIESVEVRLKSDVESLETRLLERIEKSETTLLREFRKSAISFESRFRANQVLVEGFSDRMVSLEERVSDLEQRN